MDKLTQKLLELKEKLNVQKTKRDEAKGRLDGLYAQLKERFNCDSEAEAKEYQQELEQELQKLLQSTEEILQKIAKLLNGKSN